METIKKYLFHFSLTLISIIVSLFLLTTLYNFNILNQTTYNILKFIALLLSLFINSFILGKKAKSKGYLEGLKLAIFIIFLFLIISLIFKSFQLKTLLYYLIISISSIFGSMVGISKTST